MEQVTLAVVIPVGPASSVDFVSDSIDSITHYTTSSRVIIILDDSGEGIGAALQAAFPDLLVLRTPRNQGLGAGLYLTLSAGFSFAYENYAFDVLLRMDTDALVIGRNPEEDARAFFRQNPQVGIIGSYRTDSNGDARSFSWPRDQLSREASLRNIRRLKGMTLLRSVLHESKKTGYEPGEHCLGGAYFVSRECIKRLYEQNLLSRREISWSHLQEDQIFGLFIHAVGMRHGDFATGSLPMGLRWRGLPCSPEDLIARGKKITHSTRFFDDLPEQTIRDFFREKRATEASTQHRDSRAGAFGTARRDAPDLPDRQSLFRETK